MKKLILLLLSCLITRIGYSQTFNTDSALKVINFKRDSTMNALYHVDSMKVVKEYTDDIRDAKFLGVALYPVLNAGDGSGIAPVKAPTEVPDSSLDYKLLFDLTQKNPDSLSKEINMGLQEIARVINLHVASGIPLKKIFPVIVVRGSSLNDLTTNEYFMKKYKIDNPNIKIINELSSLGAKFIACGQSMYFMDLKREALLPQIKVTLTAQTAFSSYQLKGYARFR